MSHEISPILRYMVPVMLVMWPLVGVPLAGDMFWAFAAMFTAGLVMLAHAVRRERRTGDTVRYLRGITPRQRSVLYVCGVSFAGFALMGSLIGYEAYRSLGLSRETTELGMAAFLLAFCTSLVAHAVGDLLRRLS